MKKLKHYYTLHYNAVEESDGNVMTSLSVFKVLMKNTVKD